MSDAGLALVGRPDILPYHYVPDFPHGDAEQRRVREMSRTAPLLRVSV
jgi:hypothetical protein